MNKKVVLSSMYMSEGMHTGIDLSVQEVNGKRFTVIYQGGMPFMMRNFTGCINVSLVGNKLVIDDGRTRR